MVPKYGLMGLAYAKVIQNISVLTASWLTLRKLLPNLPLVPFKWNKSLFKEMIGYSINFQIISVATMLYDPITKALLTKFGSLSMVGYYQMASKMIQKLHSLIMAANQVLVPAFAELKEKTPEKIQSIYLTSYQFLFYLAFPLYSLAVVSLPLISNIWIGSYENNFIVFASFLSIGWLMDALSSPAYHANLGIGKLRWNVVGHIAAAFLNLGLGIILGIFYQGIGVVIAWILSLALGSIIILFSYHVDYNIPFKELIPKTSQIPTVICILGLIIVFFMRKYLSLDLNPFMMNVITLLLFFTIIIIPYWKHPMRQRFMGWIETQLLKPRKNGE
jgi:O-antigen/teichoic acid export membrane protein